MLEVIMDGYLRCDEYENKPLTYIYRNVTLFHISDINRYFFALIDGYGNVLLKSAGYLSMKSCETGLNLVIQNFNSAQQYTVKEHNKRFYLSLCSKHTYEIARSSDYYTKAAALQGLSYISTYRKDEFAIEPLELSVNVTEHEIRYSLFSDQNGLFYFEVYYNGCFFLRSKAYNSESLRDLELHNAQNLIMDERSYEILFEGENSEISIVVLLDDCGRELARSLNNSIFSIAFVNVLRGGV